MQTFVFSVILKDLSECSEAIADALFEAGIDDALFGQQMQEVFINFSREASSLTNAIETADRDIQKAGFRIAHIEFDPAENGMVAAVG